MNENTLSSFLNKSPVTPSQIHNEDIAFVNMKNYLKDLLKSRIFLGRYLERRLVNQSIGYRDVVVVSAAEVELKRDLLEAQQRFSTVLAVHWIGITDSDDLDLGISSSICIWTEIDNQPFGPFWFQIKGLKFRSNEICISLKCLRHISDSYIELEPILMGPIKKTKHLGKLKNVVEDSTVTKSEGSIIETLKSALSISNLKEFLTFLFALIIAIISGSTSIVNFIGNFILSLLSESSLFVKNSTPLLLGVLDFLSKIVGGFYILLAMLLKPNKPNTDMRRRRNMIGFSNDDHDVRNID